MKLNHLLIAVLLLSSGSLMMAFSHGVVASFESNPHMEIRGIPGAVIDRCIAKRIKGQDINHLIEPFKLKNETWCWQSEFWGKWMLSAVGAYRYNHDPEILEKMTYAVKGLLKTQLDNGYIGNYGPDTQLTDWDIWGRKYSMLGLIKYYEVTGDEETLAAAMKVADHLIDQVGPEGHKVIIKTGFYRGMASSSVLEPIVYLYLHTNQKKYLDFAQYMVAQWETEVGPKLISKALEGVDVANRFPPPAKWWSWENGQKAYEMMSCYDGLLELYKIVQDPDYLKAVISTVDNIIQTEINIAGSGSAFECWYGTFENQTQPTYHTMETCVSTTWMKLCSKLMEITGNSKYADQVERTFYNALMASLKYDASQIAKYSPLEGVRHAGEEQCDMHINCCNANGPRGFVLMPAFGVKTIGNEIFVNYYGESMSDIPLIEGKKFSIRQRTDYPKSGNIEMTISASEPMDLMLNFRIPSWSKDHQVLVNDQSIDQVRPGTYLTISKVWSKNEKVSITLDMRGKLHEHKRHQAITRGPIVLARDARFGDGFVDEAAVIQDTEGIIELTGIESAKDHIWMAFTAPCKTGTDLEGEGAKARTISFTDFASAGNTWDPSVRYRVWIRKTLNVMKDEYRRY